MSILSFARTLRGAQRLTEILQVLTKHGFGHIVTRLNLQHHLPIISRIRGKHLRPPPAAVRETPARRAAMMLQDLGGTFIKLGQLLSTRPDLMPESFITELAKLQDQAPPFPTDLAKETIRQEFGASPEQIFTDFSEKPIASGSIAQVHTATLSDGTPVVVKVKRPGIDRIISSDLDLLRLLARLTETYFPEWRIYRPLMIVDELARNIRKELDFLSEAALTARFHELTRENDSLKTPTVFWKHTSSRVLTLERLAGIKISQLEELSSQDVDLPELARNLTLAFMTHYLELGIFHADPHPGNLLVSPDGCINMVDFGLVGHLSDELRSQLAATLLAVTRRDLDAFVDIYSDIGVFSESTSAADLKSDLAEFLNKYYGVPLKQIDLKRVFGDVTDVARRHHVILPRNFVLLGKSLVTVISIARNLDPDYDLSQLAESTASLIAKQRFSIERIRRTFASEIWQVGRLLQTLPRDIRSLIKKIQEGNLQLIFRHQGLDTLTNELDRATNRIAFSIILAAIILASSLIISMGIGPMLKGISILGIVGYLLAGVFGAWLLIAIIRSGRL